MNVMTSRVLARRPRFFGGFGFVLLVMVSWASHFRGGVAQAAAIAWEPAGHVSPLIANQPADPLLLWTAGPLNELANGGFEEGLTNRWAVQPITGFAFEENRGTNISGVPLLEGTRGAVLVGRVAGGSECSLVQEVAVPSHIETAFLSWLVWTDAGSPTGARTLAVQVWSPAGDLLGTPYRVERQRLPHRQTWRVGIDLAAFAGRTVRLEFRAAVAAGAKLGLDDIRLLAAPVEGLEFEVYLARGLAVDATHLVARTGAFGYSARDLTPSGTYSWQVVARRGDERIPGPVWKFQTASRAGVDHFDFRFALDPPVALEPVPFEIVARDVLNFPATNAPVAGARVLETVALAGGRSAAGVRITEVAIAQARATNGVECANLSTESIDVSDWQVWCYYATQPSLGPTRFRIPKGATVGPGALFVVRENGRAPGDFPNFYAGQPFAWSVGGESTRVGVVLLDAATNVVDVVNGWNADAGSITNPIVLPMESWVGQAVGLSGPGRIVYERFGQVDENGPAGWRLVGTNSLGALNPDLPLPFAPGPGPLALAPRLLTNDGTSTWVGEFHFAEPNANVRVGVRDYRGRSSFTAPLSIRGHPLVQLEVPTLLLESDVPVGVAGVARLRRPASADVTVEVAAAPAGRVRVTAPAVIPAGELSAPFAFEVVPDFQLQAPAAVTFSGSAEGYEVLPATSLLADDEPFVVTWQVAAAMTEGTVQTAILRLSAPLPEALTLQLSSSEPAAVHLPRTVVVPGGAVEVAVAVLAREDEFMTGPQTVALYARVPGREAARGQVTVADNESRWLALELPGRLSEADGTDRSATVRLSGRASADLTVTLVSSDPSELVLPERVVVPAGQDRMTFPLTVPDDTEHDGTQTVQGTASAEGFDAGVASVLVADDDAHSFEVMLGVEAHFAGQSFPVTLRALDVGGESIGTFAGQVTLSAQGAGGALTVVPSGSVSFSGGVWTGDVTVDRSDVGVQVRVLGEGAAGVSTPFRVLPDPVRHRVSLATADLAWSPHLGRLVATVAETDPDFPNRVVTLDPRTGEVFSLIELERIRRASPLDEPGEGRLALSDDGTMLYVGTEGGSRLRQYALPGGTLVRDFAVGTNDDGSASIAFDWQVVPGQSERVVVARTDGWNRGSVAVYDQGLLQSGRGPYSSHVLIAPDGQSAFSYMGRALGDTLYGFALGPGGVVEVQVLPKTPFWFGGDVGLDRGLIHFACGWVYDPEVQNWARGFSLQGAVNQYDNEGRMAFSADGQWVWFISGNGRGGQVLEWFARPTAQAMRRVSLSAVGGGVRRLWLCGDDTLALHNGEAVVVLRSAAFLPAEAGVDLAVGYRPEREVAFAGEPFAYSVTVTNLGPRLATDVLLETRLPAGVTLVDAILGSGRWERMGNTGRAALGDLAPGAVAEVRFTVVAERGGWWFQDLTAVANEWDLAPGDNRSQARVSVALNVGRDGGGVLSLGARALAADPAGQRLYASHGSDGGPWADRVLVLNASSGEILDVLSPGRNPGSLAVSAEGRYLYVGVEEQTAVSRIDLAQGAVDVRWALGRTPDDWQLTVVGLAAVPGQPGSVAVLLRASKEGSGSAGAGIAIYDGGVARPLVGLNADYVASSMIVFNEDGSALYGAGPANPNLEQFGVAPEGVTLTHRALGVFSQDGTASLDFALGRIVASDGRFLDPAGVESFQLAVAPGSQRAVFHAAAGRVAYVRWPSGAIEVWDPSGGIRLGGRDLPDLDDFIGDLVPLGNDRVAVRLGRGDVHLLRSSFLLGAEADTDADGLPDLWELEHGLNPDQAGAEADSDGDGTSDFGEYVAGTDPREGLDFPRLRLMTDHDGRIQLQMMGHPGRLYRWEQRSAWWGDDWEAVGDEQAGQGGPLVLPLDPASQSLRFYRIRIRLAPQGGGRGEGRGAG